MVFDLEKGKKNRMKNKEKGESEKCLHCIAIRSS